MIHKLFMKMLAALSNDAKYRGLQRGVAFMTLFLALGMGVTIYCISITGKVYDTKTCITVLELFLFTGVGQLLGNFIDSTKLGRKNKVTTATHNIGVNNAK